MRAVSAPDKFFNAAADNFTWNGLNLAAFQFSEATAGFLFPRFFNFRLNLTGKWQTLDDGVTELCAFRFGELFNFVKNMRDGVRHAGNITIPRDSGKYDWQDWNF
jgi:hypothetical protein